jgi:rhamnosyltransferase
MVVGTPRVSVIVPTKNAGGRFEATLRGLQEQELVVPFEIVIIDSGSTDGTVQLGERYATRVMSIAASQFGHGRTRNQAIATCTSPYIALTVQDAIPADRYWLSRLVAALDGNPQAAGAFSRCLAHRDASFITRHVTALGYQSAYDNRRTEQRIEDRSRFAALPREEKRRLCAFDNVGSILRRSVWEQHPFRDIGYAEDLAWGYDVLHAGYTLIFEPEACILHSHERSLWYELRRAYVDRQALLALLGDGASGNLPRLTRRRGFCSSAERASQKLLGSARREQALTWRLFCDIWLYTLATTCGSGLGELNRGRKGRLGMILDRWLATGI